MSGPGMRQVGQQGSSAVWRPRTKSERRQQLRESDVGGHPPVELSKFGSRRAGSKRSTMEGTTLATHYERLSTLDASFLSFEDRAAHMHVGSVSFLDAAPFQREGGAGLDFDRVERSMVPIISKYPRLRQKVWWPAGGPPVWIDDPKFDPTFHFRRVAVPSPASEREL